MLLTDFIFEKHTVKLKAEVADWREAIKIGTDMLEAQGFITDEYYKEIISQAEELGPYFVIAPGLAMPHTQPKFGVNETSWALVTLATPIEFGSEDLDPVDILLTMASKSSKEQSSISIVQVVDIFDNEALVEAIRSSRTEEELKAYFDKLYVPS